MFGKRGIDRFTRHLAAWGGIPALVLILAGLLALLALSAVGVRIGESVIGGLFSSVTQDDALVAFTIVCVLISVFLLLAPVCIYVTVGQAKRLDMIKGYYTPTIIARYFDQFWAGRDGFADLISRWRNRIKLDADAETNPPVIAGRQLTADDVRRIRQARAQLDNDLKARFDELLRADFGFAIYLIPIVLLVAVALIIMYFGFLGGISLAKTVICGPSCNAAPVAIALFGLRLDLVSIAAIFGAYTWVASDSIMRHHQSTFQPADLSWYALRLIVAVPLGQAIAMLWVDPTKTSPAGSAAVPVGWGAFLAFVISMFSFDSISRYLAAAANRMTGTQGGSPAERDDLIIRLPGVDEEVSRRLAAEGVTTIAELVSVDPVRVSIRSGLPFDFVLLLVDAAILWTYVGNKLAILREFGFKGASNVLVYHEATRTADLAQLARALNSALAELAAAEGARQSAEGAVQAAQLAIDDEPDRAVLQERAQRLAARLDDPALDPATRTALMDEKAALFRAIDGWSAEHDARQAALRGRLAAAQRALEDQTGSYTNASNALDRVRADLRSALANGDALLADLADKAGMKASGLANIVLQIVRDQYADFIRRLMSVMPVSPP